MRDAADDMALTQLSKSAISRELLSPEP